MKKQNNTPDEIVDGETIRRAFSGSVIKSIDSAKRQIEFIISTAAVDRYGDIVEVSGWDLKSYKANPVVLFGHNSSIPPIGKAIKTWKDGDALRSVAEFMPQDISAFAHSIFRMYEEKFLRAVSVGFKPTKYERLKDEEGNETWAYRFLKQELLEFSAVPIPANPEALVAAREKGIDTMPFKSWAEEMLDNWNNTGNQIKSLYGVERKEIENIRRRAAGLGATFKVPPVMQDEIMKRNLEAIRAARAAKEVKSTEVVTVREMDLTLQLLDDKERQKAGTVEITQEEINNEKSITIEKADDRALFTRSLLDEESDFIELEVKDVDGEEVATVTLKGSNIHVEYELLSVDGASDTILGVKVSEKDAPSLADVMDAMQNAEVVDLTEEDDIDDLDTKSADEADDEDEDDDKKSKKEEEEDDESDSDDDEDDKKSVEADEEDEPLDFKSAMYLLESTLTTVEDILDEESDVKSHGRAFTRKGEFLAGYMRELADRLDGGKKAAPSEPTKAVTKQAPVVAEDDGMNAEEASAYIKAMTDQLQPLLADMIASKLSKQRGRLD